MADPLDEVLRQVASGELSPEDAEPIIAALSAARPGGDPVPEAPAPRVVGPETRPGRPVARCASASRKMGERW